MGSDGNTWGKDKNGKELMYQWHEGRVLRVSEPFAEFLICMIEKDGEKSVRGGSRKSENTVRAK